MHDTTPEPRHKILNRLNATPLSEHVKSLFEKEKVTPERDLMLVALLDWAEEQELLAQESQTWLQEALEAVAEVSVYNPERLYDNLADANGLMEAESLKEAAMQLLRHLVDLIPQD